MSGIKKEVQEATEQTSDGTKLIDQYEFSASGIPITIRIYKKNSEFVPIYDVSIASISRTTEVILERIRQELIKQVSIGMADIIDAKKSTEIEDAFTQAIHILVERYFPDADEKARGFLTTYLKQKSLGMGNVEILMADEQIEEIAINAAEQPIWIYHRKHAWLKTTIKVKNEEQTLHYATMIGRKVGRQISILEPLLDAHMNEGDRVNATLMPISAGGNTITMRKFSRDPWTITSFLSFNTISPAAAALIWEGIQYELSALVAGGTGSGKTSLLNVVANFFPPNQRIISIEDTREIRLPKFLHWLPMSTRNKNAEGKGGVSMLDLLINSLRMRPDRILVGEVRRAAEAEVLFEAIHTGHSVYATFHANNAKEVVTRLTSPPIEVPKATLPGISMILVQSRNRRTGLRRTFQIAEITEDAEANVLMQLDVKKDVLAEKNKSKSLLETLMLYTGNTVKEIQGELEDKERILKYMVKNKISSVDAVGWVMAKFYTDYPELQKFIKADKVPTADLYGGKTNAGL